MLENSQGIQDSLLLLLDGNCISLRITEGDPKEFLVETRRWKSYFQISYFQGFDLDLVVAWLKIDRLIVLG